MLKTGYEKTFLSECGKKAGDCIGSKGGISKHNNTGKPVDYDKNNSVEKAGKIRNYQMKEFVCKRNCGECCGIVAVPKELFYSSQELQQKKIIELIEYGEEIYPVTEDGLCIFLKKDKTCSIYKKRMQVCRDYGLKKNIPCPYIDEKGNLRSPAKIKRFQRIINHQVDETMKKLEKKFKKHENAQKFKEFLEHRKAKIFS